MMRSAISHLAIAVILLISPSVPATSDCIEKEQTGVSTDEVARDKQFADAVRLKGELQARGMQQRLKLRDARLALEEFLAVEVEIPDICEATVPKRDFVATVGAYSGSDLPDCGSVKRSFLVQIGDGSLVFESRIQLALKWLADHQNGDGSWSFDHGSGPCQGRCSGGGTFKNGRIAATALALLPFMDAGQTHKHGDFQQAVRRGLRFLVAHQQVKDGASSLEDRDTGLYAHAWATLAICKAYSDTHDKGLKGPAQAAVNQIVRSQDTTGGWIFRQGKPPSIALTGWQLMALREGHMSYLQVDPQTIQSSIAYFDSVQRDEGSRYGPATKDEASNTAVGLLCRVLLGWKKDRPALERGIQFLKQRGLTKEDAFFNLMATRVIFEIGGEPWKSWKSAMIDQLFSQQTNEGHARGSWYFKSRDTTCVWGGRLYSTAIATLTLLEHYRYRHMFNPGKEDEFPL